MKILVAAIVGTSCLTTAGYAQQTGSGNSSIQWAPCPELQAKQYAEVGQLFQCANLSVPLDYQDTSSNKTFTLNLIRYLSKNRPSKGSVLYNPGGPGFGGRNSLIGQAAGLELYIPDHDIVSWDPRGTGADPSLPGACFESDAHRQVVFARAPSVSSSADSIATGSAWGTSLALRCKEALANSGGLLGTAYVARDMVQILDALGEDGLLRYYGASYGTALGQIFAAMFPDKVDKMVLDGVLNPHQYIHGRDYQQPSDSEAVLDGFLTACAGQLPEVCPLAQRDVSVESLHQQIYNLIDDIEKAPYAYGPESSQYLDSFMLRALLEGQLYTPSTWSALAGWLDAILSRDDAKVIQYSKNITLPAPPKTPFPSTANLETVTAIRASDTVFRTTQLAEVVDVAQAIVAQSPLFGGYIAMTQAILFAQWPFTAKEQYTGDFAVQTKNPILFLSNVYDPITPLVSAKNASATFSGSRLLVQEGYGHTTMQMASSCTSAAVSAYMINGTLPAEGKMCNVDVPIFFSPQNENVLPLFAFSPYAQM